MLFLYWPPRRYAAPLHRGESFPSCGGVAFCVAKWRGGSIFQKRHFLAVSSIVWHLTFPFALILGKLRKNASRAKRWKLFPCLVYWKRRENVFFEIRPPRHFAAQNATPQQEGNHSPLWKGAAQRRGGQYKNNILHPFTVCISAEFHYGYKR